MPGVSPAIAEMTANENHGTHDTERQKTSSFRLLCRCFVSCFGKSKSKQENDSESCESKTSSELERETRIKNWIEESCPKYPDFTHQNTDSYPNQGVSSDVHELALSVVNQTLQPRIPAVVDARQRQPRSNGTGTSKLWLETIPRSAPAPCEPRKHDDASLPHISKPSAAKVAPHPDHQPPPQASTGHAWFIPEMCAHKRR